LKMRIYNVHINQVQLNFLYILLAFGGLND
jgi:hypothetical protein